MLFAASLVLSAFGIPKPNSNAFGSVEGKRKKKAKRREKKRKKEKKKGRGKKERKVESNAPYPTVRHFLDLLRREGTNSIAISVL